MSPNLTLIIVAGVLVAAGVYLLLERSLTRILVGILLAGNGVNILFLVASGEAKRAPIIGTNAADDISDPLPQAMVLTAIVITLGITAFVLTMAYRSFQLNGHDEVADDVEDSQIRRLAESDLASQSYDEDDQSEPSEIGSDVGGLPTHAAKGDPEPADEDAPDGTDTQQKGGLA